MQNIHGYLIRILFKISEVKLGLTPEGTNYRKHIKYLQWKLIRIDQMNNYIILIKSKNYTKWYYLRYYLPI